MTREPVHPIYQVALDKLQAMRASGLPATAATADAWEPAVTSHHPTGPLTGSPCASCKEDWPCKVFVDVVGDLT